MKRSALLIVAVLINYNSYVRTEDIQRSKEDN